MRLFLLIPRLLVATVFSTALLLMLSSSPTSRAQDSAPVVAVATPTEVVDQIMTQIGQNQIDDAVSLMEGLKDQPELRQAARESLVHVRETEGTYRGYDVASIQRFSPRFQTMKVLAYYDDQPVLLRIHFYRPQKQDGVKWLVLSFHVITELPEMTEMLKDTPIDYAGIPSPAATVSKPR